MTFLTHLVAFSRPNVGVMSCYGPDDTAIHTNAIDKNFVTVVYQGPPTPSEFNATIVRDVGHYIAGVKKQV